MWQTPCGFATLYTLINPYKPPFKGPLIVGKPPDAEDGDDNAWDFPRPASRHCVSGRDQGI